MAQTPSNMLALGTFAPEFYLKDTVSDKYVTYNDVIGGRGTLVMFICNHCPFVLHVIDEIVKIANEYKPQGIGIIAISSNDVVKYPQDVPELMTKFAQEHKFNFAYLYDETQEIAKVYDAACTPASSRIEQLARGPRSAAARGQQYQSVDRPCHRLPESLQ